jgi:hypothetical protein
VNFGIVFEGNGRRGHNLSYRSPTIASIETGASVAGGRLGLALESLFTELGLRRSGGLASKKADPGGSILRRW